MALTDQDIEKIGRLVSAIIQSEVPPMIESAVVKLTSHQPSKDEFYEQTTEILSKLAALEDENLVKAEHITRHDDRISALEKLHPSGKHTS